MLYTTMFLQFFLSALFFLSHLLLHVVKFLFLMLLSLSQSFFVLLFVLSFKLVLLLHESFFLFDMLFLVLLFKCNISSRHSVKTAWSKDICMDATNQRFITSDIANWHHYSLGSSERVVMVMWNVLHLKLFSISIEKINYRIMLFPEFIVPQINGFYF